jgi:hypothetical protein
MEDEILKHTKKAYHEMKNSEHTFWQKTKEIFIEILIIVFAVTVSIWLHGWDEHKQQQEEVKDFLGDLKDDLKQDIQSMTATRDSVIQKNKGYYNFLDISNNLKDTANKKNLSYSFSTGIVTTKISDGDYEGFKSSGKIGYIEDKKLKKAILKYYQETTPSILELEKANTEQILKIIDYVIEKNNEGLSLFKDKKLLLMLNFYLQESESIKDQYDDAIQEANQIINEINKEHKQ